MDAVGAARVAAAGAVAEAVLGIVLQGPHATVYGDGYPLTVVGTHAEAWGWIRARMAGEHV